MKYIDTKLDSSILNGLSDMGFEEMTPIQELAIPVLLSGRDIIGQAQTGTGKTAAFGIPMIADMDADDPSVQGLILCPTRELAVQASGELEKMSKYVAGIKVVAIYGGQDIEKQIRALKRKPAIVVGTPGRVMDHMRRKTLKLDNVRMLVLDEADEMLNMGFREDIETICQDLPEDRQTALFSATMSREIKAIANNYQRDAKLLKVQEQELTIPLVKQSYYVVQRNAKDNSLYRLMDFLSPSRALIFCNTKRKVDQLTLQLKDRGYPAEALHGDLSQHQRDRVMSLFRNGKLQLLLATDVAARGIDVDDVDMVFNYDMPQDMEYYVHRIGRTGRAGKKGKAVSLITGKEKYKIDSLEEYCNTKINKKEMPTAASALNLKAYRTVATAIEYCADKDITPYMKLIYKKCVEDDTDALQIAAAFLRMSLGDIEETPPESRPQRNDSRQNNRGRDNRRRTSNGKRRNNNGSGNKGGKKSPSKKRKG